MKTILATCSVLALISTGASATDLSSGAPDYSAPAGSSDPNWATRFGVAFDAYYAHNAGSGSNGVDDDWNPGINVDFAVARESANGFGAQFDILGSLFTASAGNDEDDWTQGYLTGAIHLNRRTQGDLYGVFAGGGLSESKDTGYGQYYWFAGVEGQMTGQGDTIYFAQAGYLSGWDEYEEGLVNAGFARVGARMFTDPNTAFLAAISGAFGATEEGEDTVVGNLELEVERAFGDGSTAVFASYEGTVIDVLDDPNVGTSDFHGVMLGLRWRPGTSDLMSAHRGPASLDLPSIDRWFSFTANEIEN